MKKQSQNELEILSLLTQMQEQLTALDRKIDSLINKSSAQSIGERLPFKPAPALASPPSGSPQAPRNEIPNNRHNARPMYRATCADCQKECEIPFRPHGDRPVYCQECFRQRKASNAFNPGANKPQGAPSLSAILKTAGKIAEPPSTEKQKSPVTKKSQGKKKPVSKKTKARK